MKNLFIVYGSETKLLNGILNIKNSYFIRIYHERVPEIIKNACSVNNFEDFKIIFKDKLSELKPGKIIFIGAAFIVQNRLFILENKKNVDKMIKTNVSNYIDYTSFLLPFMKKINSGQFIYLSSFRSEVLARGVSIYSASKAFGETFFKIIGIENGAFGIRSTSIRLGAMDGRMIEVLPKEKIKELELSVGNRRLGNSKDVIKTIKYILNNDYTNGGVIDLTSGISFN